MQGLSDLPTGVRPRLRITDGNKRATFWSVAPCTRALLAGSCVSAVMFCLGCAPGKRDGRSRSESLCTSAIETEAGQAHLNPRKATLKGKKLGTPSFTGGPKGAKQPENNNNVDPQGEVHRSMTAPWLRGSCLLINFTFFVETALGGVTGRCFAGDTALTGHSAAPSVGQEEQGIGIPLGSVG